MTETVTPAAQTSATARRTSTRVGTASLWAGGVALLLGTAIVMFQRGGTEDDDMWRATWVACLTLGLLALTAPWPLVRSRWGLLAVAALAALSGWAALSVSWARVQINAADDAG